MPARCICLVTSKQHRALRRESEGIATYSLRGAEGGITLLGAAAGFLSWMEVGGSLKELGPEGVVGLGKTGGGGPEGV